jgi:hypothetical protein
MIVIGQKNDEGSNILVCTKCTSYTKQRVCQKQIKQVIADFVTTHFDTYF